MGTENNEISIGNSICKTGDNKNSQSQIVKSDGTNSSQHVNINNDDVPFINLTIDENNVIDGAKNIIKNIRPEWNLTEVQFKIFTNGITNKLVGCFNRENFAEDEDNHDDSGISNGQEDVVLVRVYGNKTDLLIDRTAETRNIRLLHSHGLAPSLFAVFNNGLVYEFVPGCTLTPETILMPEIWTLVAEKMARMHKIEYPAINGDILNKKMEPMLWTKTQNFLDLIPNEFSDKIKDQRLRSFLPVTKLRNEFMQLYRILEKLDSPIVFSHNDLLLGNVVYTKNLDKVTFIDYEYAAYNFQAFDIGNHFAEFAGIDEVDFSRFPSKDFQLEWLRVYLQNYLGSDNITDKQINKLYVQVNKFVLASHFFWAVWALIQAEHSTIDFDYVKYAHLRYNEYLAKKDQFLLLKL